MQIRALNLMAYARSVTPGRGTGGDPAVEQGATLMVKPLGFFLELAPRMEPAAGRPAQEAVRPVGEADEDGILAYLRAGLEIYSEMDGGRDVLNPEDTGVQLGTGPLHTDGEWLWRAGPRLLRRHAPRGPAGGVLRPSTGVRPPGPGGTGSPRARHPGRTRSRHRLKRPPHRGDHSCGLRTGHGVRRGRLSSASRLSRPVPPAQAWHLAARESR